MTIKAMIKKKHPMQGKVTAKEIMEKNALPDGESHAYNFRKQRGRRAPLKMKALS